MSGQTHHPNVSFVVIVHNGAETIGRALESILLQKGLNGYEVIVVDDGSTDATPIRVGEMARGDPNIHLTTLERNQGRGFARNAGVRLARGRYIATIDADIVLPQEWLSRCLEALATADAVGGTAVPDGDVAYLYKRFRLTPRAVGHTAAVTGSNALYRREVFDRVSFDPALREGEDIALNHALSAAGAQIRTVPGLIARHEENKDLLHTVAWLHQSGQGATRQLYRYRELRRPDIAFAGWLLSGILAFTLSRRGRPAGAFLPFLYLGGIATAHVRRAFVREPRATARLIGAAGLDAVLLGAYFTGRLAGLWSMRRTRQGRTLGER